MKQETRIREHPLRAAFQRTLSATKTLLAIVGLLALGAVALTMGPHGPSLLAAVSAVAESAPGTVAQGAIHQPREETALEREQRAIAEFISRRYRVALTAVEGFVETAYRAGALYSVDPLLILAVMAVESRYNPVAQSNMGAKGLMQVIPRFHEEKLADHGGAPALLQPEVNILVGTQILREYTRRLGDLEAGLQKYNGALDHPTSQYAAKVLAERARLESLRQKVRRQPAQTAQAA